MGNDEVTNNETLTAEEMYSYWNSFVLRAEKQPETTDKITKLNLPVSEGIMHNYMVLGGNESDHRVICFRDTTIDAIEEPIKVLIRGRLEEGVDTTKMHGLYFTIVRKLEGEKEQQYFFELKIIKPKFGSLGDQVLELFLDPTRVNFMLFENFLTQIENDQQAKTTPFPLG